MMEPKTQDSPLAQQGERLPCRGCQANCPHYKTCGGKPWRMASVDVVPTQPISAALND